MGTSMGRRREWTLSIRQGSSHRDHVWRTAFVGSEDAVRAAFDEAIDSNPNVVAMMLNADGRRVKTKGVKYGGD